MGSLSTAAETIPVQLSDGEVNWTILSVQKVMEYMIAESPNFKQAISEACAGAHANFLPMFAGGDNRIRK